MAGTFDLGKVVGTSATINGETTLEIKAGTGVTLRQEGNILYIDLSDTSSKVTSFNGRSGAVTPQNGDYTAAMVGAVPNTRTVNSKALSSDIVLSASDVKADPAGSATSALNSAKSYTDTLVGAINSALDTINGEVI